MADVAIDSDNKNPKELYAQGVRAYVLQDYSSAVTALGKASELLVIEHGDDLHEALGEVYLYYGKALLGLSREESEALGDAVPRNEESSEEDNVEDAEENDSAETNENNENEAKAKEEDEKTAVDEKGKEATANGSGEGATKDEAENETEDEPTDLQLAWEVLELAKKIFQKQGDSAKKNLGETLVVLGEVSLESENFDSAVQDISDGLKIQKELFDGDSRTVAETYYKLGVAYSTTTQIDAAIDSFNSSLEYLNSRISKLEKLNDKNVEVEEEIKEIKNLMPEIQEKVTDMKTYKDEAMKNIFSALKDGPKPSAESSTTASSSSSSKPVSDISHLVKRKRKADETEEKDSKIEEQPTKKTNQ